MRQLETERPQRIDELELVERSLRPRVVSLEEELEHLMEWVQFEINKKRVYRERFRELREHLDTISNSAHTEFYISSDDDDNGFYTVVENRIAQQMQNAAEGASDPEREGDMESAS